MCGSARAIIAGGTESMSMIPMGGHTIAPNPSLIDHYPDVYLSTGLVAENHARESGISREEQDAFALRSHQRAIAAIDAGRFTGEIVPVEVGVGSGLQFLHPSGPQAAAAETANRSRPPIAFAVDEGPRRDT